MRNKKPWNHVKGSGKMIVGRDIGISEVTLFSLCALVRKFVYRSLARHDIRWWIEEQWRSILRYVSKVLIMVKGRAQR